MLSMISIPRGEADRAYREFFTLAYFTQRLGQPGHRQGEGATGLGLPNPIEPGVLQHFLAGRTPDGSRPLIPPPAPPDRPAGWCLELGVPQTVSVLWAMAPEPARRSIEQAHQAAAAVTLLDLELDLGRWRHGRPVSPESLPRGTFAGFQRRATWDQMPRLSIRAVVPNVGRLRDPSEAGAPHRTNAVGTAAHASGSQLETEGGGLEPARGRRGPQSPGDGTWGHGATAPPARAGFGSTSLGAVG